MPDYLTMASLQMTLWQKKSRPALAVFRSMLMFICSFSKAVYDSVKSVNSLFVDNISCAIKLLR
jgi:hypothetical protein